MGLIRFVARFKHTEDLDDGAQADLAESFFNNVDNNGGNVGGYFIEQKGWNWVELEGDSSTIDAIVDDHLNHTYVDENNWENYHQEEVSSRDYDKLVGHTDGDTAQEMPV